MKVLHFYYCSNYTKLAGTFLTIYLNARKKRKKKPLKLITQFTFTQTNCKAKKKYTAFDSKCIPFDYIANYLYRFPHRIICFTVSIGWFWSIQHSKRFAFRRKKNFHQLSVFFMQLKQHGDFCALVLYTFFYYFQCSLLLRIDTV